VLTFPYDTPGRLEADIVICVPVVRAEARAQRKRLDDHLAHLLVHGVLHAQGHDHEDEEQARRMEAAEVAILRRFRIADPYGDAGR
jgi:probable rRNA maturation factor